jgi:hypothetical protein
MTSHEQAQPQLWIAKMQQRQETLDPQGQPAALPYCVLDTYRKNECGGKMEYLHKWTAL